MKDRPVENPQPLTSITDEGRPLTWGYSEHLTVGEEFYDMHYEWEMGIVLTGSMDRIWTDHSQAMAPGDVWFTGIWEGHGYRVTEAPCRVAVFIIRPDILGRVSLGISDSCDFKRPFTVFPAHRPRVRDTLRGRIIDCASAWTRLADYPEAAADRLVILSVLEMIVLLTDGWNPPSQKHSSADTRGIKPAVELVLAGGQPVSEQTAADVCAMSLSTFQRHFKDAMGMGFGRFALNFRLKRAADRLRNSSVPIKNIAADAGFRDLSHFYRAFRKAFLKTPAEYRDEGVD